MRPIPSLPDSIDFLCRLAAGQIGADRCRLGRAVLIRIQRILEVEDRPDARSSHRVRTGFKDGAKPLGGQT